MTNILMCCSTLNTKGGMVSVTKNYLGYGDWGDYKIKFIPTHFNANKYLVILHFGARFIQIFFTVLVGHYQIAHLHTAERGSFWRKAFLLKFFHKMGIKVVLHHHSAEFEDFYAKASLEQKEKIKKALEAADVNIVLSERLISMIKNKAPNAKVKVLYNAVQTYANNPYNLKSRNILFMGRLGARKGVFDLIETVKRLDLEIPEDIKFCLCGDVGEEAVRNRVAELKIKHRIAHVGWIDGDQKRNFISKSMINVLPSYNEGLPMTILETMAAGIPNISTKIASIPEVINDEKNGFLIEPGDVGALTARLKTLIMNAALRKIFSQRSYDLITHHFSLDSDIGKLKKIYESL